MILLQSEYYKKWYEFSEIRESTKKSYTTYLRKLESFMLESGFEEDEVLDFNRFYYIEETDECEGIDVQFIDNFIERLKSEGEKTSAIYNAIVSIKSFFTFLETTRLLEKNPLNNYPNPNYTETQKDRTISLTKCNLMLKEAHKMDPFFRQYYVLILLMVICGLRASEICKLRKSQIIFDHNIIEVVRGQKTSENTVFMSSNLSEELKRYFNHPNWQNWSNGKDKEVFFYKDKPFNYAKLNKIIKIIAKNAGIKRQVTPHDLRYTTASLLLESDVDVKTIQRQLRHKKLVTTLQYLPPTKKIRMILECYDDDLRNI